ncbi:MAG TPA: hypothetical protein VF401_00905 [Candidatus Saccharimonadales bacterium]
MPTYQLVSGIITATGFIVFVTFMLLRGGKYGTAYTWEVLVGLALLGAGVAINRLGGRKHDQ